MSSDLSEAGLTSAQGPAIANVGVPDGNRKRRVVVILADISSSMNQEFTDPTTRAKATRIEALNRQLTQWVPKVRADPGLRDVEFAVVTFGEGGVRVPTQNANVPEHADGGAFMPASALQLGPFKAGGTTPMVEAIDRAITLAENRQRYLKETHNLVTGQPRLILFSDGQPTDERGNVTSGWRPVAGRLKAMRTQRRLQFFGFGVPGVDSAVMRQLVPEESGYLELASMDFKVLLDMILIATTSSDPYTTLRQVFE